MLKRFGEETPDVEKARSLATLLANSNRKIAEDPSWIGKIEANPDAALRELGFTTTRHFRLLKNVQAREEDSCSCACFPIACGTGVGCLAIGAPGSTSSSC
jgi:hypothetical protein